MNIITSRQIELEDSEIEALYMIIDNSRRLLDDQRRYADNPGDRYLAKTAIETHTRLLKSLRDSLPTLPIP